MKRNPWVPALRFAPAGMTERVVPTRFPEAFARDCADHTMAYCCPHGMIGTVDSELCGEPSMILSLIAR